MGLFDSWFLSSEDIAAGQRADQRLADLDRAKWEAGKITSAEYERRRAASEANSAGTYRTQVDDAFKEGWRDGEQTVVGAVRDTTSAVLGTAADIVSAPIKGLFGGLPWWAWLAIIGGAVVYFGQGPRVAAWARGLVKR